MEIKDYLKSLNPYAVQEKIRKQTKTREYWIGMFQTRLNEHRYTQDAIGIIRMRATLRGFTESVDLAVLYKECDTSNNFCSHFWWRFKLPSFPRGKKKVKQATLWTKIK